MNHVFRLSTWNGKHFWLNFASDRYQAKAAAKLLLKSRWAGLTPHDHRLVIETPSGSFILVDKRGHLEICENFEMGGATSQNLIPTE